MRQAYDYWQDQPGSLDTSRTKEPRKEPKHDQYPASNARRRHGGARKRHRTDDSTSRPWCFNHPNRRARNARRLELYLFTVGGAAREDRNPSDNRTNALRYDSHDPGHAQRGNRMRNCIRSRHSCLAAEAHRPRRAQPWGRRYNSTNARTIIPTNPRKRRHHEPTEWLRYAGAPNNVGPTALSHATLQCSQ